MRPDGHAEKRNFVESILRVIPGFHGYLEMGYRREADAMVRGAIADKLQTAKPALDQYGHTLLNAGQVDALPELERVRVAIDKLIGQVKGQMRGYSGFFDYVKVTEQMLDEVYEHDLRMLEEADLLADSVEQLATKGDSPQRVVQDLLRRIAEFENTLQHRAAILQGLADGEL